MCPYIRFDVKRESRIPICEPLNELCTMCVFGNRKQMIRAEKKKREKAR